MPAKQLRFDAQARDSLMLGVDAVADAVGITLGPCGRNVVLDKKFGSPLITNDGVTIARDLDFPEPFMNMGAQLLKEVASKTNDVAGDGTTTATVLARAMITEGIRNLSAGASSVELRRGMFAASEAVQRAIRASSQPVAGDADIRRVASLSAADDRVGGLIAEAFAKVGREGVVSVEEGDGFNIALEITDGMQLDRGYVSPYLVTDQATMEAVLERPAILITDAKLSSVKDVVPMVELVMGQSRPLLIVAEEVQGEALATLVVNRLRGTFTACAIKAPGFGDRRKALLEDLAVLTGATVVSEDIGIKLDSVRLEHLGSADRVVVTKDNTTVIKGSGDNAAVAARCEEIRQQIEDSDSDWDREKLQERLARLVGGVALLKVGAATEVEMKELKARVEDALAATRAAIEEGTVPGGGVALLRGSSAIDGLSLDGDALLGARIVRRALEAPLRAIADNAGYEGASVARRVRDQSGNEGFDAQTGDYTDLVARGIIDPAKVTTSALVNATSIAAMVMTTNVLIADVAEEEDEGAAAGQGHGGGGMGMGGMGGGMGGMGMGGMDDMDF